ncbi:LPD7 domain-containing protein [Phenylobacterium sp.]|jgi:hypothetical protein|uniref:LPD7 domain-containing protein n=1 Tax=Phenylobacterium sp. TaxID=1871053 RepID=UPI002F91C9B3
MPAERTNRLEAEAYPRPHSLGDAPEAVRRRYLVERGPGRSLGYFVDAVAPTPAFRDKGRRLTTERNDPHVVRDVVAIAAHRGWTAVRVTGAPPFRREVWLAARARDIEVRGYRPTERDLQALERTRRPAAEPPLPAAAQATLDAAATVIRGRIAEPAVAARLMSAARERILRWLERGATFEPGPPRRPPHERSR